LKNGIITAKAARATASAGQGKKSKEVGRAEGGTDDVPERLVSSNVLASSLAPREECLCLIRRISYREPDGEMDILRAQFPSIREKSAARVK
jgi:hypothetical protein